MEYRHLGKTGLLVSQIGFGNMLNYLPQDEETNLAVVKRAFDLGINFFDTAENYGAGQAEEALGRAIKHHNIPREKLVITTKLINRVDGTGNHVNRTWTNSRKHIIEGTDNALKRLQLDYVDIIYSHIFDSQTSVEEVCRAFNQVIEDGKAFYWATSNWNATQIQEAINVCDRLGLHRPVAEQGQYNMLHRQKFEVEFVPLYDKFGYGTTIYSPLAGGLLTGKYNDHAIPDDSRYNQGLPFVPKEIVNSLFFDGHLKSQQTMQSVKELGALAKELGYSQAALALAWVTRNKDISTAIVGAKNVKQLEDTLTALELYKKFTPELEERIEKILGNRPPTPMDAIIWGPKPHRR